MSLLYCSHLKLGFSVVKDGAMEPGARLVRHHGRPLLPPGQEQGTAGQLPHLPRGAAGQLPHLPAWLKNTGGIYLNRGTLPGFGELWNPEFPMKLQECMIKNWPQKDYQKTGLTHCWFMFPRNLKICNPLTLADSKLYVLKFHALSHHCFLYSCFLPCLLS